VPVKTNIGTFPPQSNKKPSLLSLEVLIPPSNSYTRFTPTLALTTLYSIGGGDVMAAAETGSGKTGAFGLPIIQIVYESLQAFKRFSNP